MRHGMNARALRNPTDLRPIMSGIDKTIASFAQNSTVKDERYGQNG